MIDKMTDVHQGARVLPRAPSLDEACAEYRAAMVEYANDLAADATATEIYLAAHKTYQARSAALQAAKYRRVCATEKVMAALDAMEAKR